LVLSRFTCGAQLSAFVKERMKASLSFFRVPSLFSSFSSFLRLSAWLSFLFVQERAGITSFGFKKGRTSSFKSIKGRYNLISFKKGRIPSDRNEILVYVIETLREIGAIKILSWGLLWKDLPGISCTFPRYLTLLLISLAFFMHFT